MEIVYGHSNWLSYHSPRFLIRLIHLTELLDRRELDGVAALAQYALPNVSRGGIYESDIVDRLQRAAIMRIITSQHRFHTHCTSVIIRITEHECYAQEPQRHTSRACRSHKKVILIALTSALNRDFIAALRKLRGGMLDSCRVLEEIVSAEALKLFTLIPREFGVQRITKEPAGK
ncbi:hypothetical protein FRB94_009323 [Tulasnella sp. JGI-2019a]|nr:hypothetical protein FRB93_008856 [Tulasnella sp. JGI-2019a]KAG8995248.1 hypothetical protein FRB94_009323 [Tulasnella sp. JGI-2019a]KAG9028450.1 hypothetical protein FRB95_006482 [Tulasnella sp. JGI-2019a]